MGFSMKIKNKWWTRKVLCFYCRQQVIDNKCGCWLRNLQEGYYASKRAFKDIEL